MVKDALDPGIMRFSGTKFLAFLFPLIDTVVVTLLFMSHFSIAELTARSAPPVDWIIDPAGHWHRVWGFFVGKALYEITMKVP